MQQFVDGMHPCVVKVSQAVTDQQRVKLTEYIDRRGDWLARCALLLTRDHDAALDLVQDTLLLAWRARDLVDRANDPERYIMRIMLNTFRARSRRSRLHLIALHDGHGRAGVLDATSQVDDAEVISRALGTLSSRQQAVIILRYWADYDDKEIARILQCRQATVRSLSFRGLAKIKRILEAS